jgi:hypothetical protein
MYLVVIGAAPAATTPGNFALNTEFSWQKQHSTTKRRLFHQHIRVKLTEQPS